MPENLARWACQRIWHARHAGDFGTLGMLGMNYLLLEPRLLGAWVRRSRNLKLCFTWRAKFCCMPISMQNHSGATPSITSEQSIDDRHGKNPCMLTNTEKVAELSSLSESCPRGGFKVQKFLTWMREFSANSM